MNNKRECSNCKHYAYFEAVCCNGESEHRGNYRAMEDTCKQWEREAEEWE